MRRAVVLATIGIATQAVFTGIWLGASLAAPSYSPRNDYISELFSVGTPTGARTVMAAAVVISSIGIALIALALRATRLAPPVGVLTLLISAVSSLGIASFPCDRGCVSTDMSWHARLHSVSATVFFVTGFIGALVMARTATVRWVRCAAVTVVAIGVPLGTVLLVLNGDDGTGLVQRPLVALYSAWFVALGAHAIGRQLPASTA